jgi:CubicO group peptidase (beta-lactamase class C family)
MRLPSIRALRQRQTLFAIACAAVMTASCVTSPRALDHARFADADAAIRQAIGEHKLPGAVFHVERDGDSYEQAYGSLSYDAGAATVSSATVFDAASLSKVLATAPAVLMLAEEGRIELDARLADYFPECANGGKEGITIRHLLTHSSGLPSGLPAKPAWHGDAAPTRWPAIRW